MLAAKKLIYRLLRFLSEPAMRWLMSTSRWRNRVNRRYNHLSPVKRRRFHQRYRSLFDRHAERFESGTWQIDTGGFRLTLPLDREKAWQHWNTAISIVGHDLAIKQTYRDLIRSRRPDIFVDAGANYGTHSLLFLSAGVPTLSFEPNPYCAEYFHRVCALNGFSGRWEQTALGDRQGTIELAFPERETWLGTADQRVAADLTARGVALRRLAVPVARLDDYLPDLADHGSIVLKIDVEGVEEAVLAGGQKLITDKKPLIIFESNDPQRRASLYRAIRSLGYEISPLPWAPNSAPLTPEEFEQAEAFNFCATATLDFPAGTGVQRARGRAM